MVMNPNKNYYIKGVANKPDRRGENEILIIYIEVFR